MTHSSALATAISQLIHRSGRVAQLASEGNEVKLDWVEGVGRLLHDSRGLEGVEAQALQIRERGIRHIIWAGMGGSVMAVQVLVAMGFGDGSDPDGVIVHPLDSTDPGALNRIVKQVASLRGREVPAPGDAGGLRAMLSDVLMVGVAMGMTSEEPITHLRWFEGLLCDANLQISRHMLVMTLPGSLLDRFARERGVPAQPLQLDGGTGTGGRMSAPATRVFLLPAALWLVKNHPIGSLRSVLQLAWERHALAEAVHDPEAHPFVRLAVALEEASDGGSCRMLLDLPGAWRAVLPWVEQLMEESLGKGGKGVLVFDEQELDPHAPFFRPEGILSVRMGGQETVQGFALSTESLGLSRASGWNLPETRLSALAAMFLGWQLTMALYGYLEDIPFAGQPAVEDYKARARALREGGAPLEALPARQSIRHGDLTLYSPRTIDTASPAAAIAEAIRLVSPRYLDITFNGELPPGWGPIWEALRELANRRFGVPLKIRRAPAAYHSTEQSEMDGPSHLVSLRILAREHETSLLGNYDDTFLQAQAIATWQAMVEAGRECFLLLIDGIAQDATDQILSLIKDLAILDIPTQPM